MKMVGRVLEINLIFEFRRMIKDIKNVRSFDYESNKR